MKFRTCLLLILLTLIAGCSEPLPKSKLAYAGEWRNQHILLIISTNGTINYKKVNDGQTTSINAPIKGFLGDDFEVGIGVFSTVFKVAEPPRIVDGEWKMTVDGEVLTKQSATY